MTGKPLAIIGDDVFEVHAHKTDADEVMVFVKWRDDDTKVILCDDEIRQLRDVLNDIVEGRVEYDPDRI